MNFIREKSFNILINQRRNYVTDSDKDQTDFSSGFVMHSINSECTSQGAAETLGGAERPWLVYPTLNSQFKNN